MKRAFVDTNFIVDLVARPEYSSMAKEVLTKGREKRIKFSLCFLSLANYAYIDRKQEREKLHENLRMLCTVFEILPNDKKNIVYSINLNPKDFEDAIQYSAALNGKCDCIITRNKKDFIEFSQIPVLTPSEFLDELK
ncbi:MAG: PIN domain-containing protein [Muribaculaceae bacterium]|nr:PIN domain-containing protein [Muribaculaceae bacterium]